MTAPDKMWAPTSEPFSRTTTERFGIELLQPDRRGESGRPGADDDDVEFHCLTHGRRLLCCRHVSFFRLLWS